MNAGKLRERIIIQALAPTTDATWGAGETPIDVATVWARVVTVSGTEAMKDAGIAAAVLYEITIRYRSDVSSSNRLSWRGKTLEIISVVPDERHRQQLLIQAKETT